MRETEAMTTRPSAYPPLVVGTDGEAVRRSFQWPIGMTTAFTVVTAGAAVLVAALAASTGGVAIGVLSGLAPLVGTVFLLLLTVLLVHSAATRAATGEVLRLDTQGMRWTMPIGSLEVPWDAVTAISVRKRGRHRIITFSFAPRLQAGAPDVRSTMKPAHLRRLITRGAQLGSLGIDVPVETVLAATSAFTNGRLVAR